MRDGLTFGVEEEFLLVDPETWRVTTRAEDVIAKLPPDLHPRVRHELLSTQIEVSTPICRELEELRWWLAHLRRCVAEAAERAGCRLMAAGTGLLDFPGNPPVAPGDRYARMAAEFRALVEVQGICACHVHVGVDDRDLAAAVSNHLRPWLPVLHALSVNSPYAEGRDTGYASWRSVMVTRWPSSGPPPWLDSAAHHDRTVANLITSGALLDTRMVYWYTRISPRYPTIEMRTGDVCSTVDEAVLVAALTRALVANAITEVRAGHTAPSPDDLLLQAAHWRAARDGLEGMGVDVLDAAVRPAWELVDRLVDRVEPALGAHGDREPVEDLVARVRSNGSGAARQRAVYEAHQDVAAVAQFLVEQTIPVGQAGARRRCDRRPVGYPRLMKTTWKPHEKHGELTERSDLPDSVFAFPEKRKEPLTDARHVRNALARFDQVEDVTDGDRDLAFANILAAAEHYDVDVSETSWRELGKP